MHAMNDLLRANLRHVRSETAVAVAVARPMADEIIDRSRDGFPINGITSSGRARFFHSRYSVDAECARLADTARGAGFVVVFGLGLAHHVRRIAADGARVVVVEPNPALIRTALSHTDLTSLLASEQLRVVVDPDELERTVASRYNASIDGRLVSVDLDGRVGIDPSCFTPFRARLHELVGRIVSDVTTQSAFSRQWVRNGIGNLIAAARGEITTRALPDWSGRHVVVAAAGPSLENHLHWIRENRARVFLLATDTALPTLQSVGAEPDLVAAIDCQHISYLHALTAPRPALHCACDLSVPRLVASSADSVSLLLSRHPLHQFLALAGYAAEAIDAGDGTVTGASVRLALSRDPRSVTLAGADLSYPNGFGYCRGSYVDTLYTSASDRIHPLCGRQYAFVADRPGLTVDPKTAVKTTALMLSYRERLIATARAATRPVYSLPCAFGLPLPAPPATLEAEERRARGRSPVDSPRARTDTADVSALLQTLRDTVSTLPRDQFEYRALLEGSGEPRARAAAACLLPALHARRVAGDTSPTPRLLCEAADEIVGLIDAGLAALAR
ncbi:MAG: DUF115 domain-containing protein [Spirochaetaceae bacterium]|nr:MAG: DUF115 domain-containing protein [Spirochaetaceae bacterium]